MDVRSNWYPRRFVDPNEPGLVAAYTLEDNELAQFGRYINRASTGAVYDLTTMDGTPFVAQGAGILATNNSSNVWRCPTAAVTGQGWSAAVQLEFYETATALRSGAYAGWNGGTGAGAGFFASAAGGTVGATYNSSVVVLALPGNMVGRGPVHAALTNDGVNQIAYLNGTFSVQGALPAVLVLNLGPRIGGHGAQRALSVYNGLWSAADVRSKYIRHFASKVLWQWTPRDVGEGPAGGILTGSYSGVGGWTCPLGAATMSFVQRGDRLTLTDTQAVNLNRIDFEFASRPLFGTWIIEYQIRDPATDSPVIGFTPRRGVDPMAASSTSYWAWIRTAAGPWWRVSMGYENNTAVPIDSADAPWPGPNAGDRCIAVVSRDVDGSVQTWNYVPNPTKGWWWTTATGNHVTTLAEGCITVAPRGSFIERITWLQGSASPHELGIQVP